MNDENLIDFAHRSKKEHREIASRGGKASVESRRQRKKIKEDLLLMLETVMSNGKTTQENWMTALAKNLLKGDISTANFVRDTIGEKPAEEIKFNDVSSVSKDIGDYANSKTKGSN